MGYFFGLASPLLLHTFRLHNPAHRFSLESVLLCLHIPYKLRLGHLRQKALLQLDILRHILTLLLVLRLQMGVYECRGLLSTLGKLLRRYHAGERLI
jgi:hypothetical protein